MYAGSGGEAGSGAEREPSRSVRWEPASGKAQTTTAAVHVDVGTWVEHPGDPQGQAIDATLTFNDPAYGSAPIPVVGRFCRWDALVC